MGFLVPIFLPQEVPLKHKPLGHLHWQIPMTPSQAHGSISSPTHHSYFQCFLPYWYLEVLLALVNLSIHLKEFFIRFFLIFTAEMLLFNWSFTLTLLKVVSGSFCEMRALDI